MENILLIEKSLSYLVRLEDGCSDPDMKDNIQVLRFLMSILKPFLRVLIYGHISENHQDKEFVIHLKSIVVAIRKVNQAFELLLKHVDDDASTTRNSKLVTSNLEVLKSLKEDIVGIVTLSRCSVCVSVGCVQELLIFVSSLTQNLKDIATITCKATKRMIRLKKERQVIERLQFLATFLWLLFNNSESRDVVISTQKLAFKISYNLFLCFRDDVPVASDHMITKEDILPELTEINTLLLELRQLYLNDEFGSTRVRLSAVECNMKGHVLGFVNYLIHKLRELSNNKDNFIVATAKIQIDSLVDELKFMIKSSLVDMLFKYITCPSEKLNSLLISIEALIIHTGFFIHFSLDKEGHEEFIMANYLSSGLPNLVDNVDAVHQTARALFQHLWISNNLSTGELEFVDFVINKIDDTLLHSKVASIDQLKHQIVVVHEEMVTLRKNLSKIGELQNSQMESLLKRFRDAASLAEFVIYPFAGKDSLWISKLGLFVLTKDVKAMQEEVKSILKLTCVTNVRSNIAMAPSSASSQASVNAAIVPKVEMHNKVEETDKIVGLKDATRKMIEQLIGGSRQLKILSIVGMPGLGKTTLTNSVYKHPSVGICFDVRAWYCLSQVYHEEALLSSILAQICQETDQSHEINKEDCVQKLYQNLKGRKYLIVLDDLWDIETWNGLKQIFPDDNNGSRILFTTQSHVVASQSKSLPYALPLLSVKESCELLWLKVFNEETCPQELSTISKRVAINCKGLPLAVVLIAGILKMTERNKDSWEQVAKTLISPRNIQEKISEILEVSYNHLPNYLKPCFHYFRTFPKSTTISVSKIIRLWISEGFVHQHNQGKNTLKQEAESYLHDLIDRSLVMIARKSSKGGVEACCIHDTLQEFCSVKLEEERSVMRKAMYGGIVVLYGNFITHKSNLLHIFSRTKDPDVRSLLYSYTPGIVMDSRERDCPSERVAFRDLRSSGRNALSEQVFRYLLSMGRYNLTEQEYMFRRNWQHGHLVYSSILKYKNLRVLDLGNVRVQSSAETSDLVEIARLVHLKYLAVRVRTTEIPSEIGNLRNLETLLLTGAIGMVMLPEAIWKLVSLRDVIMDHCFFSIQLYSQEFFEHSSQLDNLKSISTLCIWHGNVEKFIRRMHGVQKLGCIFSTSWQDHYEASNLFKLLEILCELQSLKMSFRTRAPNPFKFSFPSSMKKLTLSNARISWNQISVIGQLPNLEVLKLLNRAFEGHQWDMRDGEFQKLKFLKLESLDIITWNAFNEHLPCLEQLLLVSCQRLEEIPSCFGEIPTLQLIEMKWCSASARNSVKQILEDQRDLSNDQLKVIVVG
ncbi:hypothetical protein ACH5RR_026733 [Cinchona calisaya]|uniref:Uncharacterized protein n=1 Tax=Cinchona calisaya TaxID=153742 RepID=A0ABD2Z5B0_9GENT